MCEQFEVGRKESQSCSFTTSCSPGIRKGSCLFFPLLPFPTSFSLCFWALLFLRSFNVPVQGLQGGLRAWSRSWILSQAPPATLPKLSAFLTLIPGARHFPKCQIFPEQTREHLPWAFPYLSSLSTVFSDFFFSNPLGMFPLGLSLLLLIPEISLHEGV